MVQYLPLAHLRELCVPAGGQLHIFASGSFAVAQRNRLYFLKSKCMISGLVPHPPQIVPAASQDDEAAVGRFPNTHMLGIRAL